MQTELFEISGQTSDSEAEGSTKTNLLEKKLMTLRFDQAIGVVLVLMVGFVLSFSWGVDKGKKSVQNSQVIKAAPKAAPAPAVPILPKNLTVVEDVPTVAEKIAASPAASVNASSISASVETNPVEAFTNKPDGKYTIQHVIYLTRSAAERESKKLSQKGHQAFIIPSGKYLQVCIDGFATKKEATSTMKLLRNQGTIAKDAYVRNIPA